MDGLKPLEKKFVKAYIKKDNATQAVKKVYEIEDDNYAAVKGHDLLRKPKIVNAINKALPDSLLAQVHLEGLSATKYETVLTGRGESEIQEVPDYAVRHRYLDTGYKVKGKYGKDDETPTGNTINNLTQIIIHAPTNGTSNA